MDLQLVLESAASCLAPKPTGFDGNVDGYDKAIIGLTDNCQLFYSNSLLLSS
jgi:hypothetical protein